MWRGVRSYKGSRGEHVMKCKQCGCELVDYTTVAYCPLCKIKRTMKTVEIDPTTGEWEGVTHD